MSRARCGLAPTTGGGGPQPPADRHDHTPTNVAFTLAQNCHTTLRRIGMGPMPEEILQTHKLLDRCEKALAERYTVHKLHEAADKDALIAKVAGSVRGIAGGYVKPDLMDKLPRLEIIANFGVGYDTIDTKAAKERNIRVTNT